MEVTRAVRVYSNKPALHKPYCTNVCTIWFTLAKKKCSKVTLYHSGYLWIWDISTTCEWKGELMLKVYLALLHGNIGCNGDHWPGRHQTAWCVIWVNEIVIECPKYEYWLWITDPKHSELQKWTLRFHVSETLKLNWIQNWPIGHQCFSFCRPPTVGKVISHLEAECHRKYRKDGGATEVCNSVGEGKCVEMNSCWGLISRMLPKHTLCSNILHFWLK